MLIEFLFENYPNWEDVSETAIGDLQVSEVYINYLFTFLSFCSFFNYFLLLETFASFFFSGS